MIDIKDNTLEDDIEYMEKLFSGEKLYENNGIWLYKRTENLNEYIIYDNLIGFINSTNLEACYEVLNNIYYNHLNTRNYN